MNGSTMYGSAAREVVSLATAVAVAGALVFTPTMANAGDDVATSKGIVLDAQQYPGGSEQRVTATNREGKEENVFVGSIYHSGFLRSGALFTFARITPYSCLPNAPQLPAIKLNAWGVDLSTIVFNVGSVANGFFNALTFAKQVTLEHSDRVASNRNQANYNSLYAIQSGAYNWGVHNGAFQSIFNLTQSQSLFNALDLSLNNSSSSTSNSSSSSDASVNNSGNSETYINLNAADPFTDLSRTMADASDSMKAAMLLRDSRGIAATVAAHMFNKPTIVAPTDVAMIATRPLIVKPSVAAMATLALGAAA